ncbi:hypothetical protein [Nocardioides massiliensis]|uniref:Uncharacterized protein n=1 Tax=Nocardioides massiliensis TaxID=1325935 RepID=A0ABT9NTI3_9ACTN|nr:hypothetical protein [Nocardioides massiliensis]MDP9823592.1 hypothetical protein [Nocardioides massiliensis]
MTYQRRAYDDQSTTQEMHDDCSAAGSALRLPARPSRAELVAELAVRPAPSLHYADRRETTKPVITVTAAAQRLAVVFDRD